MNSSRALAGIGAASAVVLGGAALAGARQLSGPQRPSLPYSMTPFEVGLDFDEVRFTAADGTQLAAWWLDRPDAEQVVVVCHGHRGSKADMLGIGPGLARAGAAVLMLDFRGSGDSADGPQSLAHYEQLDLRAAIDWVAAHRPGLPINLVGFSMGAATAILVAAGDQRVRKVVADSPFADMRGVVAHAVGRLRLPAVPLTSLVDLATRARYGYRFNQVQPIEVVGQLADRELLLVHATADTIIPFEHHQRLAAAAPWARTLVVPDADHCGGYFADRPGYIATVAEFLGIDNLAP